MYFLCSGLASHCIAMVFLPCLLMHNGCWELWDRASFFFNFDTVTDWRLPLYKRWTGMLIEYGIPNDAAPMSFHYAEVG